jgi:hypothetical protein
MSLALVLIALAYVPLRAAHQRAAVRAADTLLTELTPLGLVLVEAGTLPEAPLLDRGTLRLATATPEQLDIYLVPVLLLIALLAVSPLKTSGQRWRAVTSVVLLCALQPGMLVGVVLLTDGMARSPDPNALDWLEAPLAHAGFALGPLLWLWSLGLDALPLALPASCRPAA